MRRKRKRSQKEGSGASWLITFSDMMTLLLTFFVLLLSMAALRNDQKQFLALGSIAETFGMGKQTMSLLGKQPGQMMVEPGPFDEAKDLAPIRNILWEDKRQDIEFISNRFIQILSIQASLLFSEGEAGLSSEGRDLLRSVAPQLRSLQFPVLVAGHASYMETGFPETAEADASGIDPSWRISLDRVLSVYSFLIDQGVPADKLKLEAFGRYQPRYASSTRRGRRRNRRVDIILDKRNFFEHSPNKLKDFPGLPAERSDSFRYKGFRFDLKQQGQSGP